MADQDFNINVRTTADLAGVAKTEAALSDLQRRAAQIGPGAALAERDAAVKQAKAATEGAAADAAGGIAGAGGISYGPFAIASIAAFTIVRAIREATEEQKKLNDELDKQRELLFKSTEKWQEQAQAARTLSDVDRVITRTLGEIQAARTRAAQVAEQELTITQRLLDTFYKIQSFSQVGHFVFGDPVFQKGLDQSKQGFQELAKAAEEAQAFAFQTAEALKKQSEVDQKRPIQEVIDELKNQIKTLQELQEVSRQAGDFKTFRDYGLQIEEDTKKLQLFYSIQQRGLTGGPGGTSVIQPAAPPRTVAEWRADQAKATEEFQRTHGPQAIADWRAQQEKAMAEYRGETPRFGGSSANDVLTTLKDQNALMKQMIDLWK